MEKRVTSRVNAGWYTTIRPIYTVGFFMAICIGGPKAWKRFSYGDIFVALHWINGEPTLCVAPTYRMGTGAYAIPLQCAHAYADSASGEPSPYLVGQSIVAAKQLGFSGSDTFAAKKIARAIVECLPELVEMPPEPQSFNAEQRQAIGEMSIKVDGQTIAEKEITALDAQEMASV